MSAFTIKGTVTPFTNGTKIIDKYRNEVCTVLNQCYCTSNFLHYEALSPSLGKIVVHHEEVGPHYTLVE